MKAPSCTSCRLRRRKCDKQKPICGSCKELGIPADLCTYKILKTNTKVKDLKTILDTTKLKNRNLIREKLHLKKVLEERKQQITEFEELSRHKLPDMRFTESDYYHHQIGSNAGIDNGGVPTSMANRVSQIPSAAKKKTHSDSISWASLMSMEPKMKVLLSQIDRVLNEQKSQLEDSKKEMKTPFKKTPKLIQLRSTGIAHALKLDRTDLCADIYELLNELQNNIPNKAIWDEVLGLQTNVIPSKYVGFIHVDHQSYREILNRAIDFDKSGNASLDITLPQQVDKLRDLAFLISYLIFPGYHTTQVIGREFPMTSPLLCSRFSETLIWYHRLLSHKLNHSDDSQITPEYLQTLIYNEIFHRYTPHGEHTSVAYEENAFCIRRMITIGRKLHLNQDIDLVYANKTEGYRNSLKSTWHFLAFFDIMESLDNGFPPKIETRELIRYENYSDRYTESLIVLNRVLHRYIKLQLEECDDARYIHVIEQECIGELQELLKTEYRSWDEDYQIFQSYKFEDTSRSREFTYESASFCMRFTTYSAIQMFYFLCFGKASSSQMCSPKLVKRLDVLSLKYSYLMTLLINVFFDIYNRLVHLPRSTENGVLEMMLATFPHLIFALKKLQICAGAKIFRSIQLRNVSAVKTFLNGTKIDEKSFLKKEEVEKKHNVFKELFSIDDLADSSMDSDEDKVLEKFSALTDFKFVLYVAGAITVEMAEKMFAAEKSDLKVVKLNHVFFYLLKVSSFFMNCSFYSDGTPFETTHFIKGLDSIKPIDPASFSTEFDFQRLFEEAINTNSENFDFGGFFNISNGTFQNSEIDEFLIGYPSMPNEFNIP